MDLLCLQEENISDLELRVDWLGSKDIMYFSVRQSMHPFLTGLKAGRFVFKNLQEILGWCPLFFCLRKSVESVVLFFWVGVRRLALCLLYIFLNFFARQT